ncbi:MAG TPA: glycosyltransferase family 39 protein, partial [Acidimicrobiales bacterium]|nr:glycosyltransferase family 39 protein [Acidimicrobiales bacterium]
MRQANPPSSTTLPRWVTPAAVAVVLLGVAMRVWTPSAMWLDEALTVNIAKLPLAKLPGALRHDGAPPLYYGLLHVWMRVFGTSDFAARALSSVLAVGSLPLVWLVGRRLAGPRAANLTLLLVAVSPFAVRYATEARMYTLVIFLVLLGILAFERALDDLRRPGPLVAVGVLAGLLVLTHYWALFLTVAAAAAMLARRAWPIVIAIAVGTVVFFLPWAPVFLYQSQHTGTPWAAAPGLREVFSAVVNFAGGNNDAGVFLGLLFLAFALVAVYGRPAHSGAIELAWPGDRAATPLASVTFGALFVGVAASVVARSGFAPRYASVVLAPFLVVVALGLTKLPSLRTQI